MKHEERSFVLIGFTHLIISLAFFYSGVEFSMASQHGRHFVITCLLVLILGLWIGKTLVDSLRYQVKGNVIVYPNKWSEFCGPRNILLVLFISALVGVVLMIYSFQYRFSDINRSQFIFIDKEYYAISLMTTIALAVTSTMWFVVASTELVWGLRFESKTGRRLYQKTMSDDLLSK